MRNVYIPGSSNVGKDSVDKPHLVFARNLNRAMLAKGWDQSETARRAEPFTQGKPFGRHLISNYVRGKNMPNGIYLDALCKGLGLQVTDLLPADLDGVEVIGSSPTTLRLTVQSGGTTRVKLDMELDTNIALQIAALVNKDTQK